MFFIAKVRISSPRPKSIALSSHRDDAREFGLKVGNQKGAMISSTVTVWVFAARIKLFLDLISFVARISISAFSASISLQAASRFASVKDSVGLLAAVAFSENDAHRAAFLGLIVAGARVVTLTGIAGYTWARAVVAFPAAVIAEHAGVFRAPH